MTLEGCSLINIMSFGQNENVLWTTSDKKKYQESENISICIHEFFPWGLKVLYIKKSYIKPIWSTFEIVLYTLNGAYFVLSRSMNLLDLL